MADQPNVFDEPALPVVTVPDPVGGQPIEPEPDKIQEYLQRILNDEGKPKYDSLEKALEALEHSQNYIPQLKQSLQQKETELNEAAEKLKQQTTLEETVQRLKQMSENKEQPIIPVVTAPAGEGLDEARIAQLLEKLLEQKQTASLQQSNEAKVNTAINAKFGEKATEVVAQRAAQLGMTPQQLGQLSQVSPDAVLELFNVKPTTITPAVRSGFSMPPVNAKDGELPKPTKSLLSGATSRDQKAFMLELKQHVYNKHGITS